MSAQIGDVGTIIRLVVTESGVVKDISDATTKEISIRGPSGRSITKAAVFTTDGTDGKIQAATAAEDLGVAGIWTVQGRVVTPSGEWRTRVETFAVERNITT